MRCGRRPAGSTLDQGRRILDSVDRSATTLRRRGWFMRRMLLAADVAGLLVSFAAAGRLAGTFPPAREWLVLLGMVPIWIVAAKIYGLYDRDEERVDYSTVDDFVDVFHLVTVAAWLLALGGWMVSGRDRTSGSWPSSGRLRFRA